jgi:hypothetical protein
MDIFKVGRGHPLKGRPFSYHSPSPPNSAKKTEYVLKIKPIEVYPPALIPWEIIM